MCGIMGFVTTTGWTESSKKSPGTARVLAALMAGIEERGDHASGIAFITEAQQKVSFGKRPIPSSHYLATREWDVMIKSRPKFMIGHARFATHGSVNNPINNHPHVSNNRRYALVHNGVVTDGTMTDTRGWCDSEKILSLMGKIGVEKAAHIMADSFKASSYAVLAIDAKAQKLWAFRNSRSPCVLADMTDTIGGIVFCSTLSILEEALELCDIDKEPVVYDLDTDIPYYFPINCKPGLAHLKFKEASYAKTYIYSSYDSDDGYSVSTWPNGYRKTYSPPAKTGPYVGSSELNKERRERIRLLSQDETPLSYELRREGKVYKTWKEYFKDYPATFESLATGDEALDKAATDHLGV